MAATLKSSSFGSVLMDGLVNSSRSSSLKDLESFFLDDELEVLSWL